MSDYDARLVGLYDQDNPDGPDHDFYRSLADEHGAQSILDVGCGTGILTTTFARDAGALLGWIRQRRCLTLPGVDQAQSASTGSTVTAQQVPRDSSIWRC